MRFSMVSYALSLTLLLSACKFQNPAEEAEPPPAGGEEVDVGPVPFEVRSARLPFSWTGVMDNGDTVAVNRVNLYGSSDVVVFAGYFTSAATSMTEPPADTQPSDCSITKSIPLDAVDRVFAAVQRIRFCERRDAALASCLPFLPWNTPALYGDSGSFEFSPGLGECGLRYPCDDQAMDRLKAMLLPYLLDGTTSECRPDMDSLPVEP